MFEKNDKKAAEKATQKTTQSPTQAGEEKGTQSADENLLGDGLAPLTNEELKQGENQFSNDEENYDFDAAFKKLEGKKISELNETTAVYLNLNEMEKGGERDFIFIAKTDWTDPKTGETLPAVKLRGRDGINYLCASKVIVDSCFKLEKCPSPIRILYNGKKKGTNGDYFDVKVFTL